MTRKERLHRRNNKVKNLFDRLSKKHPQWRVDALINEVSIQMFLAPRTIDAILKNEGTYSDKNYTSNNQKSLFDQI